MACFRMFNGFVATAFHHCPLTTVQGVKSSQRESETSFKLPHPGLDILQCQPSSTAKRFVLYHAW
jgi:hypothetical protein